MPRVGVMIGVGVAPVKWFLEIEQGTDPHHRFIQPACSESRAVSRFVTHGVNRD